MDKRFLFRFWDTVDKCYLPMSKSYLYLNLQGLKGSYSGCKKTLIPQQNTGLVDKNEKDIYEGDIISFKEIDAKDGFFKTGEVTMTTYKGAFVITNRFKGFNVGSGLMNFSTSKIRNNAEYYDLQVIGNIYQNPELLIP